MDADGTHGIHGTFHCSFCGKFDVQVEMLIAGDQVWVCSECVEDHMQMLITHRQSTRYQAAPEDQGTSNPS